MTNKTIKLLLIEDDSIDVQILRRAISKSPHGFDLEVHMTAEDGLNALTEKAQTASLPDVVMLDIKLPTMNGHEVLEQLRKDAKLKDLTVFLISTSFREADRKRGYSNGISGYIFKDSEDHMIESLDMIENFLTNRSDFSEI